MTTPLLPTPPSEDGILGLVLNYIHRLQGVKTLEQIAEIERAFNGEKLIIVFRALVLQFMESLREARIKLSPPLRPTEVRILFASANPSETSPLPLDRELSAIQDKIRITRFRDSLEMVPTPAVQFDQLVLALNEHRPHIVHFTGHGDPTEGILLVNSRNEPTSVPNESFVNLFKARKGNIRIVVLNACYSREQADAITSVIDCAIGMNEKITSAAAITFMGAFYQAIGFGHNVLEAFEEAKLILGYEFPNEADIPQLLRRPDINPADIRLISPLQS